MLKLEDIVYASALIGLVRAAAVYLRRISRMAEKTAFLLPQTPLVTWR